MFRPLAIIFGLISATSAFATTPLDTSNQLIISVRDQKLMLLRNGETVAIYPVSTSMFGLGDAWGRMTTPLGYLAVERKIGISTSTVRTQPTGGPPLEGYKRTQRIASSR